MRNIPPPDMYVIVVAVDFFALEKYLTVCRQQTTPLQPYVHTRGHNMNARARSFNASLTACLKRMYWGVMRA